MRTVTRISVLLLLLVAVKVYATTYNATINNTTSETIGTLTYNLSDNTHPTISVGGYGQYTDAINAGLISITINGQIVTVGIPTVITLPNNHPVKVTITPSGPDSVVITIQNPV